MPVFHTLRASLQKALPTRESLAQHAWLRPVAHQLLHPQLWRLQHESVARGVAIGTFWAFVIPLGQTFIAAAHCTWWRGNIPAAAVMTMLTNPLTFGFWLWLAYPVGNLFLGTPMPADNGPDTGWASGLQEVGGPVLLGMGIFGVGGAALAYGLVKLGWRVRVALRRRRSNAGG
ncbi:MAG: DUF2062 domain-containing protein [Limnohabitans sp.]|jgi:uncharacterized protein (DUF2062 family)|uniref:DUF2062 domain-containing protein n=1 Tax=Limnohabitans sp. TaxID=1907725 RepID=UPI003BAFC514